MESPKDSDWKVGKRILSYVASTIHYGLWYTHSEYYSLARYIDIDFVGNIDERKNTSGYAFHLGTNLISWASKKQPIVTISSIEAKYVVATLASFQIVRMRRLLKDIAHMEKETTPIFYENNSSIALSKNHVFTEKANILTLTFTSFESLSIMVIFLFNFVDQEISS